jgi:tetratricopeptide (TPR) repeat protein
LRPRNQLADLAFLLLALLGPILLVAGLATQGLAILSLDYPRLAFIYGALGLCAAAAAYLALSRRQRLVRLIAGGALLVNLGSLILAVSLWSTDMRRALAETTFAPVSDGQIGIAISLAGEGSAADDEMGTIENDLREIIQQNGLSGALVVRRVYPIYTEEQAQRIGERLRTNIVIWKSERGRDRITPGYHVTVLGANEAHLELEPVSLMALMATQNTFTFPNADVAKGGIPSSVTSRVVASVAAGFGSLTIGQPLLAAGLFQNALDSSDSLPTAIVRSLHVFAGMAYFDVRRPDLAIQEYEIARGIEPDAASWIGTGIVRLSLREWQSAIDAFNQALVFDPYSPIPYCALGIALARERNVARAVAIYQQAIALQANWGVPYALVGLAYELEANIPAARQAYQNCALRSSPNMALQQAALRRADEIQRHPPTAVPTATPLPTITPIPIPTQAIYKVEQGDTLRKLANKFGVSIEAIMEANKMDDPNTLMVGQILLIPRKP